MGYTESLWLFFALVAGIIIVPGLDMMFVLANALTSGRRAGLVATFGLMGGGVFHTLFGTFAIAGLATLVPSIATPMMVLGSAYMIWIGISLARSAIVVDSVGKAVTRPGHTVFLQGLVTSVLNPKAWLFVLAVFPQFVRAEFGPLWAQGLALGAITVATQFAVYGGLAMLAAQGRSALVGNPGLTIWTGRGAGILLVAIAIFGLSEAWNMSAGAEG